ncbi:MAG: hypothetical protein OXE78_07170 [Gammaproteobacteria bacterium]|nr:hypothetical protein [Gammaproteobacteria bacterium]MCY4358839.1 hypothetical protein [Gammaproteobacteria bacterium]
MMITNGFTSHSLPGSALPQQRRRVACIQATRSEGSSAPGSFPHKRTQPAYELAVDH